MPRIKQKHIPVLLKEVLDNLSPTRGESYLDVTAGYGGHAAAVMAITANESGAVLIDRDVEAGNYLKQRFEGARVINADFLSSSEQLLAEGLRFDMILADLGTSSPHFDDARRGFGFSEAGPLDMRMDQRQEVTARQIVNEWEEPKLAQLLKEQGQEPKAARIAELIVKNRPIKTTAQLATIVSGVWPGWSRRHPATRTFQAIRMAVNDELEQLHKALPVWLELLSPGGRIAIISFHSLEDRQVKLFFKEHSKSGYEAQLKVLTPKPISAGHDELVINQRARSAKLRAASKIKTKER